MSDRHEPDPPVAAGEAATNELAPRQKKRKTAGRRKPARPRPRLTPASIGRVLLRHAEGPTPEKRLVVAVITLALSDLFSQDEDLRQSARDFLQGQNLDHWASSIGLDGTFVRELAQMSGYLPRPEPMPDDRNPTESAETNDAGLQ